MKVIKTSFTYFFLFVCSLLILSGCKDKNTEMLEKQKELDEADIQEYLKANSIQNAQRQATGLYYVPQVAGNGAQIQKGSTVKAHYINRFLSGYKLESTYDSGQPGTFVIGQSNVVPGLTDGLLLLKNGEKATIIIPSHLGYGRYGAYYQGIPPNAVLVYEINVLEVK